MRLLFIATSVALVIPGIARAQSTAAIDAEVWSAISASVVNQDIDAMAATYHPDAVVVTPGGTVPARDQLPKWGKDMETAKAKGETATVEFRFSKRLDNAATAFETGIFKYSVIDSAGKSTSYIIPMEALLVRTNGRWVMVMERQLAAVGATEWEALKP